MMIALSVTPNQVWGMAGGARNRLAVMGGFARQGFVVPKSDFDHLDGVTYGLRLTRSWGRWNHGLDYSVVSGSRIKNFILSDNYSGTYQLEFSRIALLLGFASGKFASHLILGSEAIKWSGTPELGHKTTTSLFYGVDFSYDILVRQSVRVPLMLTVLSHPARSFDFSLYPNDSLVAQAAVEYQLATGVAIEF